MIRESKLYLFYILRINQDDFFRIVSRLRSPFKNTPTENMRNSVTTRISLRLISISEIIFPFFNAQNQIEFFLDFSFGSSHQIFSDIYKSTRQCYPQRRILSLNKDEFSITIKDDHIHSQTWSFLFFFEKRLKSVYSVNLLKIFDNFSRKLLLYCIHLSTSEKLSER